MAMSDAPDRNLAKAIDAIREAVSRGASVVCLPELFLTRYFCQSEDTANFALAEPVPGPTTARLGEVARELGVTLIASLFERRTHGLYHNTAALLDSEGRCAGIYRKMHIPDDPRYYEKFYFTPGDLGFRSFATSAGRIGILICWDQWYPEAARLTALTGAEMLFYPTAIGWHPEERAEHGERQVDAWTTVQRSHAVTNGCYVAVANRVGFEPDPSGEGGIEFWGRSFVAGPDGALLAQSLDSEETVLIADIDVGRIDVTRTHWPFLRDRRIDAYENLSLRFADKDAPG